jgi:predicted nucleic acid-binding protein
MDEIAGRREAARRHLHVIGTLAVLEQAAQKGLLEFRDALQRLERTNFRLSAAVRDEFLLRNP